MPKPRALQRQVHRRAGESPEMGRWNQVGYGLDYQGEVPVIVRATRRGARLSYASCKIDDAQLQHDLENGRPFAVSMSPRQCLTPRIEAPYGSKRKAAKVFPTLLDIQLPFALEDCVYIILADTAREGNKSNALAIVARKTDVWSTIKRVQELGIDVTNIDHEGVAIWQQSLREMPPAEGDAALPRVIVYFGVDRTTLIVGIGDRYMAAHGMSRFNLAHLRRLLRSSLGADGMRVQWFWTGPKAENTEMLDALKQDLVSSWPGHTNRHDDTGTFLARAVAARCLAADSLPCNLRVGPLAHPVGEMRAVRAARRAALLMLGAGLLLCAGGAAANALITRRVSEADQLFNRDAESVLGYSLGAARGAYALRIVRQHVNTQEDALAPLLGPFSTSLTEVISGMVRLGIEEGVRYERLVVNEKKIECRGALKEWGVGEILIREMASHGYEGDLIRGEATGDGWIPFSIKSRGTG